MPGHLEPPMPTVCVLAYRFCNHDGCGSEKSSAYSRVWQSSAVGTALLQWVLCWGGWCHQEGDVSAGTEILLSQTVCKGVFWMVAKCCQCGGAAVQVQLPAARWKALVLCSCPLLEIALHILLRCLCWGKRDVHNHCGCWARWLSIKQTTPPNFTVSEFWNVRVAGCGDATFFSLNTPP